MVTGTTVTRHEGVSKSIRCGGTPVPPVNDADGALPGRNVADPVGHGNGPPP